MIDENGEMTNGMVLTGDPASQAKLFAKMATVLGQIERVKKDGTNVHFNYKFASDGDVYDEVRNKLSEQRIAFFAHMISVSKEATTNPKTLRTRAAFLFTFACGDTGATMTCRWESEAEDQQDKGINKAATAALKYFLLKTFMIPTGDSADDPDSDSGKKAPASPARTAQPADRRIPTAPAQKPAAPAPAQPSELDAHFGPRGATVDPTPEPDDLPKSENPVGAAIQGGGYDPANDTAPFTSTKFEIMRAHLKKIGRTTAHTHGTNAVLLAMVEAEMITAEQRGNDKDSSPQWAAIYGKFTVAEVWAAVEKHYAAEPVGIAS